MELILFQKTRLWNLRKLGVAMGNADKEIKKYADYVTDSVEEDGILNALKHFKIL